MADCNLELLQLHPSSSSSSSSSSAQLQQPNDSTHQYHHQQQLPFEKMSGEEQHPLTIFYGGAICVVNVNQQQARSIMLLAGRGEVIDERTRRSIYEAGNLRQRNSQALTSLSMKRSLQRFLEKRKHRIQSTNPYQDNK